MLEIKNNSEFGEIYIYGDVTSDSSGLWSYEDTCPSIIVDQIKELGNKPLNIRINSLGGSVFGGVAIYNALKSYKGFKTVYIDGYACSIASVISMCADKIVMYKNSYMMIHSAWTGNVQGNADELRKTAELLDEMDSTILNIYKTKLKDDYSVEDLQALIKAETWLKAEQCIAIFNDIEIAEEEVVAYAKVKDFINKYKNIPSDLLDKLEEDEDEEEKEVVEEEKVEIEIDKDEEEKEEQPIKKEPKEDINKEEGIDKPIEKEPIEEEKVEEEIEEMEDNAEDVEDKVCEECGCDPCICEEITRKEQKEKLLAKAMEWTKYLQALDYINKKNNE